MILLSILQSFLQLIIIYVIFSIVNDKSENNSLLFQLFLVQKLLNMLFLFDIIKMIVERRIFMKIKKILKFCFVAILIVFLAFIAFRVFMTSDRTTLDEVYPTDAFVSAYKEDGKDAFVTYKLPYDMSEDGYFTAYSVAYCKGGKELQITVRYNDSLSENYLPDSDPDKYYFELRDEDGNTISRAEVVAEKERYFYNHFRLAFSNVEMDKDTELYLFLCCDECQYPADHTRGIIIKHPSFAEKTLTLSKSEKEALSE